MAVDWFTISAQIVNFLILVYLLKRFLYGPIVQTMEQREENIAARLKAAEDKRRRAEDQIQAYSTKAALLEADRDRLREQAKEEVNRQRSLWIAEARAEVDQMHKAWVQAAESERSRYASELRRQITQAVCEVSRQVVAGLANAELERQVVNTFLQRLLKLSEGGKERLKESCRRDAAGIEIASAFQIGEHDRVQIAQALQQLLGIDVSARFRQQPELVCGISMETPALHIEWSVNSYCEHLMELLSSINANHQEKRPRQVGAGRD